MKPPINTVIEPTIQQLFNLSGKVALVTGGTGYLGRSLANALAEAGARVVVGSTSVGRAETFARQLPDPRSLGHLGIELNHMQEIDLQQAMDALQEKVSCIDILVNNGHEATSKDWTSISGDEFTRQLANATGYFLLARWIRDHAVESGCNASVIMTGSMYGLVSSYPDCYEGISSANPVAYQVLKGGIIQMTRHLAAYWAQDKVRVNCISPGTFPSEAAPAALIANLSARVPMKRMGQPHELKGAVVFLASDASSYITGHNLVVDGGWTAW